MISQGATSTIGDNTSTQLELTGNFINPIISNETSNFNTTGLLHANQSNGSMHVTRSNTITKGEVPKQGAIQA